MQTVKLSDLTEEICRDWLLIKCTDQGLNMDEIIKIDYDKAPAIIEDYLIDAKKQSGIENSEPKIATVDTTGRKQKHDDYILLSKAEFVYEVKCAICGIKTLSRVYACGEWDQARDVLYNNRCNITDPGHDCDIERFSIIKRILYPIIIDGNPPAGVRVLVETFNENLKK